MFKCAFLRTFNERKEIVMTFAQRLIVFLLVTSASSYSQIVPDTVDPGSNDSIQLRVESFVASSEAAQFVVGLYFKHDLVNVTGINSSFR